MPAFNPRLRTLDSLSRSPIHQSLATPSSHVAMARCRTSCLNDPDQAMDVLRSLVQTNINEEIHRVMCGFIECFFAPAMANARENLGEGKVNPRLIEETCISALEHAKCMYVAEAAASSQPSGGLADKTDANATDSSENIKTLNSAKRKTLNAQKSSAAKGQSASSSSLGKKKKLPLKKTDPSALPKPNTDLILTSKSGKPVRREGPKWEPNRLKYDTMFILGSKANKALGFAQTRGRLYMKHPALFKYSGDQEDKEWLAKNQLMTTTGGKAYLMVLSDILELARTPEYIAHPRQQPGELVGFTVPPFMVDKMNDFIVTVRTDPALPDDQLVTEGERQIARWEEKRKKNNPVKEEVKTEAKEMTEEVKKESEDAPLASGSGATSSSSAAASGAVPDDLGFLHGMNLSSLVREFEMEAAGSGEGSQNLAILSLADDDEASTFPELPEEVEEMEGKAKKEEQQPDK